MSIVPRTSGKDCAFCTRLLLPSWPVQPILRRTGQHMKNGLCGRVQRVVCHPLRRPVHHICQGQPRPAELCMCVYPDETIGCQGISRTRKVCSAQQRAITRSRTPSCHRRIRSVTMRQRGTRLWTCSMRSRRWCNPGRSISRSVWKQRSNDSQVWTHALWTSFQHHPPCRLPNFPRVPQCVAGRPTWQDRTLTSSHGPARLLTTP